MRLWTLQLTLLLTVPLLTGCPRRTTVRVVDGRLRPTRYVSPTAYEHYLRAELYRQRGAHRDAISELRAALIFDESAPYLHARLAGSLTALGQYREAEAEIRRGLTLDADHPDVLLAAAALASAQHRRQAAERALERCVAGPTLDERCTLRLASHWARDGRLGPARALLTRLSGKTGSAKVLVAHADLCLATLDLGCAEEMLKRALRRRSALGWLIKLATVQQAGGQWQRAQKSWRAAFDRSGGSLAVAGPLLTTLGLAGDRAGSDDLLTILERQVDARNRGGPELAELMLRAERAARALKLLERLGENKGRGGVIRARALAALDQKESAHRALEALMAGPAQRAAAREKARLYERGGQRQDALALLTKVDEAQPGDFELRRERARLSIDAGQIEKGLALLKASPTAPTKGHVAKLALALALSRAGRDADALREAHSILATRPDDAPTLNLIGYTLVREGKRLAYARGLLYRAHLLQPLAPYILDSIGFYHLRQGELSVALKWLRAAHRLVPAEPEITAHLAETHFKLGRKAEALTLMRGAMRHASDMRLAARLRARLSQMEGTTARKISP